MLTQYILYMMHVESQIRQIYTHMTQWIPARFYFCQQFVIAIAIAIFLGGQLCLRASFAICFAMQTVASARLVHTQVIQEQKGNRQRRRRTGITLWRFCQCKYATFCKIKDWSFPICQEAISDLSPFAGNNRSLQWSCERG